VRFLVFYPGAVCLFYVYSVLFVYFMLFVFELSVYSVPVQEERLVSEMIYSMFQAGLKTSLTRSLVVFHPPVYTSLYRV